MSQQEEQRAERSRERRPLSEIGRAEEQKDEKDEEQEHDFHRTHCGEPRALREEMTGKLGEVVKFMLREIRGQAGLRAEASILAEAGGWGGGGGAAAGSAGQSADDLRGELREQRSAISTMISTEAGNSHCLSLFLHRIATVLSLFFHRLALPSHRLSPQKGQKGQNLLHPKL